MAVSESETGTGMREAAVPSPAPLLELSGISKKFPGCLANDAVDLRIEPGRIHALLGENGAGKSTLVRIIYGALQPDAGTIRWQGRPVAIKSPAEARRLGIGMVFQHFSLFEALTVAENIALGLDDRALRRDLRARMTAVAHSYGLAIDPDAVVHELSVGERQRVEILRCLLQKPKLLIMDEPTSVLTPQEASALFDALRRLAAEGCAILYISHKLDEVRQICKHATIMRAGRVVAECDPRRETAGRLAQLMIGAALQIPTHKPVADQGAPPRLVVKGLSLRSGWQFGTDLKDIDFAVSPGEIFGIAGIAGNGQGELMAALSGEMLADAPGRILIDGRAVGRLGPAARRALGAGFVPEERNDHGAVRNMSLSDNALLSAYRRRGLVRAGLIDLRLTERFAGEVIADFDVQTGGPETEARALSGGNLQKFIVGREILQAPGLLVVAQPSWGLDAGATAAIHSALLALADKGAAVVIISQDLDEIFALCDRLAVIAGGRLSAAFPVANVSIEQVGLLMGGSAGDGRPDPGAHAAGGNHAHPA